jgi:hypothetical protein
LTGSGQFNLVDRSPIGAVLLIFFVKRLFHVFSSGARYFSGVRSELYPAMLKQSDGRLLSCVKGWLRVGDLRAKGGEE